MSMKLLVISITVMCVLITVIDRPITMKLPAMFDQNPPHTLDEIVGEQKGVHA